MVNGEPSFTEAIDKVAILLHADGWSIVEVKQCAVIAVDPAQGAAGFQVIAVAKKLAGVEQDQ
jgi:hypothetical protein